MNINDIIEIVKLTEQRGRELLIDALMIGIEIGRSNIKEIKQVVDLSYALKSLKVAIDQGVISAFERDKIFDQFLDRKGNDDSLLGRLWTLQQEMCRKSKIMISEQKCQICETQVQAEDKWLSEKNTCLHIFHQKCVQQQFQNIETCPVCGQMSLEEEYHRQHTQGKNLSCCPTIGCEGKFLYIGQEIFRCMPCKRKFCLKCGSDFHYGQKCKKIREFTLGQNNKECPKCKQWVTIFEQDGQFLHCGCKEEFCVKCGSPEDKCSCLNKSQSGLFCTIKKAFSFLKR